MVNRSPRILLVDDDPVAVAVFEDMAKDYIVKSVDNARDFCYEAFKGFYLGMPELIDEAVGSIITELPTEGPNALFRRRRTPVYSAYVIDIGLAGSTKYITETFPEEFRKKVHGWGTGVGDRMEGFALCRWILEVQKKFKKYEASIFEQVRRMPREAGTPQDRMKLFESSLRKLEPLLGYQGHWLNLAPIALYTAELNHMGAGLGNGAKAFIPKTGADNWEEFHGGLETYVNSRSEEIKSHTEKIQNEIDHRRAQIEVYKREYDISSHSV